MEHLIIVFITVIAVFIAIGWWKANKKNTNTSQGTGVGIEKPEEEKPQAGAEVN